MWGNIPYYREDDDGLPQAERDEARRSSRTCSRTSTSAIKLLPDNAAEWRGRTRDEVDGQGVQGPRAGLRRAVRRRAHHAARQSTRAVPTSSRRATIASGPASRSTRTARRRSSPIQASANDGEPNGQNANCGDRLNFPHSGSPFGCCGFHQPSQNLVNFFRVDANGLPLALTDPANWNADRRQLHRGGPTTRRRVRSAARLDGRARQRAVQGLGDRTRPGWIRSACARWHLQRQEERPREGQRRAEQRRLDEHAAELREHPHLPLRRPAADARRGGGRGRLARERAGDREPDQGACGGEGCRGRAPSRDHAWRCRSTIRPITWATYRVGQYSTPCPGSSDGAHDAVRYERRLELAMEGQRFFDLRRVGDRRSGAQRLPERRRRRRREDCGARSSPRPRPSRRSTSCIRSRISRSSSAPWTARARSDAEPGMR